VNIEADFAASVHFVSFSIQLRKLHLNRSGWVSCGNLKLEVELVSDEIVKIPTLALPSISPLEV
jgi:hypothetical protein